MTEQKIQKQISDALKGQGWFVTKLIKTTTNGIPDVLACKDNQCVFIEVKRPGWTYKGTQREAAQLKWIEHVVSLGGKGLFATGPEDVWV